MSCETLSLLSPKPIQLVDNTTLSVNQEAIDILSSIHCQVKVIGVIGQYRYGKSYLMNRVLGVQNGFELGHTVNGTTRGIWMWGRFIQEENGDESLLICLDTEGLFDVKSSAKKNNSLFVLSLLLTSVLIDNIKSNIKSSDIQGLGIVTQLTELLLVRNSEEADDQVNLKRHLPHFVFLIRDFMLEFGDNGNEEGYLKQILDDIGKEVTVLKDITEKIVESFPGVTLQVLPPPALKSLSKIEQDPSLLHDDFKNALPETIKQLRSMAGFKTICSRNQSIPVPGSAYIQLVCSYVEALNNSKLPSIPDAFQSVVKHEEKRREKNN